MKKYALVLTICAAMLMVHMPAYAAENPGDKLVRGVANIITAPIEIAKQIDAEWKKTEGQKPHQTTAGIFSGLFKGLAYSVGRMGSGIWDVVSFPFKVPGNYDPIMKPDYVLDKDKER